MEKYVVERLRLYQDQLFLKGVITKKRGSDCLKKFRKPWWRKYRFMLVCDVALILIEEPLVIRATEIIKECLFTKQQADIGQLFLLLRNKQDIEKKYLQSASLVKQYRDNNSFFLKEEKRIVVTANMSAGKSTLINALIGKPIARTSQGVCTENVCYLFNKAYEDGNVHLLTQDLNLSATADDLHSYEWNGCISIASYFEGIMPDIPRLCIIDTPGVDAALYKEHRKCTYDVLRSEIYDTIIYVVSPTRLGTDAEKTFAMGSSESPKS